MPGTSESRYINQIKQIIQQIKESNNETIIGIDQNIDFLNINENKHSPDLYNTLISLEILPAITKPTLITQSAATSLDNIYLSKNLMKDMQANLLIEDFSDHLQYIVSLNNGSRTYKTKITIES